MSTLTFRNSIVNGTAKAKASRLSFGEELAELGAANKDIVVLDADLSKSTRTDFFADKFPERFYNMGIAEANMIGVAAGLANAGRIPFAATFGAFLTGRFDQIRMSVSFSGTNVRLIGTHAGVAIGEDGHSQMALEDLALMRSLPNMTVFQPADDKDTRDFLRWSLVHQGPCYVRLTRQNLPCLNRPNNEPFAPGKWQKLSPLPAKDGVVLLGSGGLVEAAVDASDILAGQHKMSVGVVNANWIKPIDEALLVEIARSAPKLVVTLEDHYTVGGLGGAVAEFCAERGLNVRVVKIGVEGFGQSGSPQANYEHYGFTPAKIAEKVVREVRAGRQE